MSRPKKALRILAGMVGILLVNLSFVLVCLLSHSVSALFYLLLSAIGFSQFIYGVPLLIWLWYSNRGSTMPGVLIGMGITALVNAGYYLFLILRLNGR
jgi:hypothetical protein